MTGRAEHRAATPVAWAVGGGDAAAGGAPAEPVIVRLADGAAVRIRQLGADDLEAVRRLHRGMSPESLYLRFFCHCPRTADEISERLCREPGRDHAALGAWLADDPAGGLVGIANYEPTANPGCAEVAIAVADGMHHRGVGTLLLELLVSLARSRGVRIFQAEALAQNVAILRLLESAGLPVRRSVTGEVVELTMPLRRP
jgi:RimJ/RimL family protein N-acetyltransferase